MNEIIYGVHSIRILLKRDYSRFEKVFIIKGHNNKRLLPIIYQLKNLGIIVESVDRRWMNKKTKNAVHQGIIACVKPDRRYKESDLYIIISRLNSPFLLVLDHITDPHNLGACLRSAEAAGIDAVIIPKYNSAQLNATVKKVACGATENIPLIKVTNISRTLYQLQKRGIWIVGTTDKVNRTLYDSKLIGSIAFVMGAEDNGIHRLTMEYCNELISIPMARFESSLNVSVATGICLFEAVRQRRVC